MLSTTAAISILEPEWYQLCIVNTKVPSEHVCYALVNLMLYTQISSVLSEIPLIAFLLSTLLLSLPSPPFFWFGYSVLCFIFILSYVCTCANDDIHFCVAFLVM